MVGCVAIKLLRLCGLPYHARLPHKFNLSTYTLAGCYPTHRKVLTLRKYPPHKSNVSTYTLGGCYSHTSEGFDVLQICVDRAPTRGRTNLRTLAVTQTRSIASLLWKFHACGDPHKGKINLAPWSVTRAATATARAQIADKTLNGASLSQATPTGMQASGLFAMRSSLT